MAAAGDVLLPRALRDAEGGGAVRVADRRRGGRGGGAVQVRRRAEPAAQRLVPREHPHPDGRPLLQALQVDRRAAGTAQSMISMVTMNCTTVLLLDMVTAEALQCLA